ncbi:MAG: phage tail protein [Hyphomicrobiaceae bacterium]|nr:phage tail protein [Hyphomicrobiaceae bacterium]
MSDRHDLGDTQFGGSALPNNSSKFERALAAGLRILPEEWQASGRVGDVKTDLLDETVPFMIWELGLEPVMPYISEPRRVLKDGREWQKICGTPVSITMSLGWIDVKAQVEENPEGLRWDLFQLGLDEIPRTEKQIADIIGLAKLSKASNTELIRIYSGYDLRGARLNKARINGSNLLNDWSGSWVKEGWPKLSFGRNFVGTAEFGANWPLLGWSDTPWPKGGFKSRQIYRADSMERFKRQRGFRINRHCINGQEKVDPRLSQGRTITSEVVRSSNLALRETPWPQESWPDHGLPTVSWPLETWPQGKWADIRWPAEDWRSPVWPDGGWPACSWQLGQWEDRPHARLREKPWPLGPWRSEHYDTRPLTATAVPYQVPYDEATFTGTSHLADRKTGWLLGPWPKHWPRPIDWQHKNWPETPLAEWPFGAVAHSERLDSNIADISHRKPAQWPYDGEPQVPHSDNHWPGPWSDNPWPPEKWADSPWPGAKWADQAWPGIAWPETPWFGSQWQDSPWPGTKWTNDQWPGSAWGNKPWPATSWTDGSWPGSKWQDASWPGVKWTDRQWPGSAWGDKVWPAIGWMDSPWPKTALPSVPWPDGEIDECWGFDQPWPGTSWPVGISDDHIWGRETSWPAGVPWPDGNKDDKRWGHDVPWPATGWHKSLADDGVWGKSQPWPAVVWPNGIKDDAVWGREAPWPGAGWHEGDWLSGPWLGQNWPDDPWRGADGWADVYWPDFRWPHSNVPENGYPSIQWFTGEWPDWPLPRGRWPQPQLCHSFKAKRVLH